MLVENHQPNSRQIGTLYLIPGVNRLDKKDWDIQMKGGYKRSVDMLIETGVLSIQDETKVTQALVAKTYDPEVLEDWLADSKGPLKGAIKKQLKTLEVEEK